MAKTWPTDWWRLTLHSHMSCRLDAVGHKRMSNDSQNLTDSTKYFTTTVLQIAMQLKRLHRHMCIKFVIHELVTTSPYRTSANNYVT